MGFGLGLWSGLDGLLLLLLFGGVLGRGMCGVID